MVGFALLSTRGNRLQSNRWLKPSFSIERLKVVRRLRQPVAINADPAGATALLPLPPKATRQGNIRRHAVDVLRDQCRFHVGDGGLKFAWLCLVLGEARVPLCRLVDIGFSFDLQEAPQPRMRLFLTADHRPAGVSSPARFTNNKHPVLPDNRRVQGQAGTRKCPLPW